MVHNGYLREMNSKNLFLFFVMLLTSRFPLHLVAGSQRKAGQGFAEHECRILINSIKDPNDSSAGSALYILGPLCEENSKRKIQNRLIALRILRPCLVSSRHLTQLQYPKAHSYCFN
jgi:hypothetical protein